MQTKEHILAQLKHLKPHYAKEGFIIEGIFGSYARGEETTQSDIDILIHTNRAFVDTYGFESISRLNDISKELEKHLGAPIDLASRTGMGKTAHKFIIDKAIYL